MITNRELQKILDQVNGIFKSYDMRISKLEDELKNAKEAKVEKSQEAEQEKPKRKPGRPRLNNNG